MILSYLCLVLVCFIVASPQLTVLSSRSPINAHSDREFAYCPMSGTTDDVDSVPLSDGDSSTELLSAESFVCGTARGRRRWSRAQTAFSCVLGGGKAVLPDNFSKCSCENIILFIKSS